MNEQLNVLIVDSNADARECLRDLLEVEGYSSMSAPPGAEALHLIRESEEPCIVLLHRIGEARTGLQQLAIMEHEKFLLEVALSVLNTNRSTSERVESVDGDPTPTVETLAERHLFQLAMTLSPAQIRPIARLVSTSVRAVYHPVAAAS